MITIGLISRDKQSYRDSRECVNVPVLVISDIPPTWILNLSGVVMWSRHRNINKQFQI